MTKLPVAKIFAVIAFSAAAALAGTAQAQDFPSWPLSQICKSGDNSCARFEQFARGQISGTWRTLPSKQRQACIAETQSLDKSYRLLQGCLANAMQELLKYQQLSQGQRQGQRQGMSQGMSMGKGEGQGMGQGMSMGKGEGKGQGMGKGMDMGKGEGMDMGKGEGKTN